MSPRIAATHWRRQVKVFEAYGCRFVRQRGDHLVYEHPEARRPVIIPRYDEIPVSVIRTNMRTVGMTRDEYLAKAGALRMRDGDPPLVFEIAGAGGYGPASERDPSLVLEDLRGGRISRAAAVSVYGLSEADLPQ